MKTRSINISLHMLPQCIENAVTNTLTSLTDLNKRLTNRYIYKWSCYI